MVWKLILGVFKGAQKSKVSTPKNINENRSETIQDFIKGGVVADGVAGAAAEDWCPREGNHSSPPFLAQRPFVRLPEPCEWLHMEAFKLS